jgi:hypothetical protein
LGLTVPCPLEPLPWKHDIHVLMRLHTGIASICRESMIKTEQVNCLLSSECCPRTQGRSVRLSMRYSTVYEKNSDSCSGLTMYTKFAFKYSIYYSLCRTRCPKIAPLKYI